MANYIDMQVLADAKVSKIAQPTLKLKNTGVTILPGMDGAASAGLRYTPASTPVTGCTLTGFSSTTGNASGTYTYDGSDTFTLNNNKIVHENSVWQVYIGSTVVWRSTSDGTYPWDVAGWTVVTGSGDSGLVQGVYGTPTAPKWEYNNGSAWITLSPENGTLPSTQVIQITAADLTDGVATIQHNLGKVPFGLDVSVTPKAITYVDNNTMTLDFSDQATGFTGASVWFIGSQQSMLV